MKKRHIWLYGILNAIIISMNISACGKIELREQEESEISKDSSQQENTSDNSAQLDVNNEITEDTEKQTTEKSDNQTTENLEASNTAEKEDLEKYKDILNKLYYNIAMSAEEDETGDTSYLFYHYNEYTLSDIGYKFIDLNKDGNSELIISTVEAAADGEYDCGMLYDLYSFVNREVVHLASSGERDRYYLCENNTIYNEGSGGASCSSTTMYELNQDGSALSLKEMVLYDSDLDEENPWFYSTEECYNENVGYDKSLLKGITQEEANAIEEKYVKTAIDLTLLDNYTYQGDMPAIIEYKQAFQQAINSENIYMFLYKDFDQNGTMEAFGITGERDGDSAKNVKVYFINHNYEVVCINETEKIYGYGYKKYWNEEYMIFEVDNASFLCFPGANGADLLFYGVKGEKSYQLAISSNGYSWFEKAENGLYRGGPEGDYEPTYYRYNLDTGEFEMEDMSVSVTVSDLIGNWSVDNEYTMNHSSESLKSMYGSSYNYFVPYMTFGEDGVFEFYIGVEGGVGTYTIQDGKVIISYEDSNRGGNITDELIAETDGVLRLMDEIDSDNRPYAATYWIKD